VIALQKNPKKLQNTVTIEQSASSHASKLVERILRGRIEKKIEDLKLRHPRCVRYNKVVQVVESNTTK